MRRQDLPTNFNELTPSSMRISNLPFYKSFKNTEHINKYLRKEGDCISNSAITIQYKEEWKESEIYFISISSFYLILSKRNKKLFSGDKTFQGKAEFPRRRRQWQRFKKEVALWFAFPRYLAQNSVRTRSPVVSGKEHLLGEGRNEGKEREGDEGVGDGESRRRGRGS